MSITVDDLPITPKSNGEGEKKVKSSAALIPCRFYASEGNCANGDACRFKHGNEREVWTERPVVDVSGGLIMATESKLQDSEPSTEVPSEGPEAAPACISISTVGASKGALPSFAAEFKGEADEEKRSHLKIQTSNLADRGSGEVGQHSSIRQPPPTGHVDRVPTSCPSPLKRDTYETCYASLQQVISNYK
eukprot:TRINITY_DN1326_c2_g1_i1.p1 TRINITY_DN1326_c2_g1~~TRINITY_DN1326_c2_g1_i1.p1  ORF type:complete len:202 (+),score=24.70 TRINITY_DN1326_c2_g1_i1:35-607(+)